MTDKRKENWEYKSGEKFGDLTVIKRIENKGKHAQYLCKCSSENHKPNEQPEVKVTGARMRSGRVISCGCKVIPRADYTGQVFSELTVLRYTGVNSKNRVIWECRCSCGKICQKTCEEFCKVKAGKKLSCGHLSNVQDITGQMFGKFKVLGYAGKNSSERAKWLVVCIDCQQESTRTLGHLRRDGERDTCHCKNTLDLTGKRFGKLVVKSPVKPDLNDWNCLCDCGQACVYPGTSLRSGRNKSCSCLFGKGTLTHRLRNTYLYRRWQAIKDRTGKKRGHTYYTSKGITVCEEWQNDAKAFIDWAAPLWDEAVEKYGTEKLHLDRIDSEKGYSPDNCRFVDSKTNQRNKAIVHKSDYDGVMRSLTEIHEMYAIEGLSYDTFLQRVIKYKWSIHTALNTPPDIRRIRKDKR